MRTLVEALYILAGLAVAAAMTIAAAWAYPLGREVFWWCGGAAMALTLAMGIRPLRKARARDKGRL